jgi:multidrug resistance efflux pump
LPEIISAPEFSDASVPDRGPPAVAGSLADKVRSLRLPDEEELSRRELPRRLMRWGVGLVIVVVLGWLGSSALRSGGWLNQLIRDGGGLTAASSTTDSPSTDNQPATSRSGTPTATTSTPTNRNTSTPAAGLPSARTAAVASSGDVVLEAKGYIIPSQQILVSPLVNGRILNLSIEEGRRVEKGEVLAEIETTEYAADLARAQALLAVAKARLDELQAGNRPEEIAAAKAELNEAEANRAQLYSDWKRKTQLRETRVLTDTEYEQAEALFKAMDRRVERLRNNYKLMVEGPRVERIDVAKAEVDQAEAEVKRSKWRLDNCVIRAPVSGTILKKNAEQGNIVNPIAFQGSFSLCEMADLSDLEVELSIQERDISRVVVGQRCQVRAEAYPDRVYEGVVSRLMPIADRAKGAIPVRVKLTVPEEEEGVYLKPEMGAVVSFLKSEPN